MKPFVFLAVLASLTAAGQAASAAPQNSTSAPLVVVPGKSAGKVWLGATRATVHRLLGKPGQTSVRKLIGGPRGGVRYLPGTQSMTSVLVDEWLGPVPKDGWSGEGQRRFAVIFHLNRAVQLEWNAPQYRTAGGISVSSSLAQFRRFFRPVLSSYLFAEDGGGFRWYVYDDVKRGLAFTFGGQDNYDARIQPETLRIHRPGYAVIPDPGGKPIKANDEIPVSKTDR